MENELREKYIQTQMMDKQIKQVAQQLEQLDEQIAEIGIIVQNLGELKDVKVGSEILVPIHNGLFLKAKLLDSENLIVNVGGGTTIVKPVSETQEMLTKQSDEINEIRLKLAQTHVQLAEQATMLESEVKEAMKRYEESNAQISKG